MSHLEIALTNLGKYNEGELVYTWLKLPATDEEIKKAFDKIGVANGTDYEEFFISDYDTDVNGLEVGEYERIEGLNELAERLKDLDEWELETLDAIHASTGYRFAECLDILESGDYTYYKGLSDWKDLAYQLVEDGLFGDIPQHLENYIDYELIGHELSVDYVKANNGFICVY